MGEIDTLDDLDFDSLGEVDSPPIPPPAVKAVPAPRQAPTPAIHTRGTTSAPLYFDIETIPDYSRIDLFDLPPLPGPVVETPLGESPSATAMLAGTVPQIKAAMARFVPGEQWLELARSTEAMGKARSGVYDLLSEAADAKNAVQVLTEARHKKMATSPEMCRIVSIATAFGDGLTEANVVGESVASEVELLSMFWVCVATAKPLIGFNILGFDLPVIFTRSMLLGVEPSKLIDRKSWGADVLDLMAVRWPRGAGDPMKLKSWARALGIEVPAEGVDGSQVEELFEHDRERLAQYNASDVEITREIHRRGKGIWWL